MNFIDESEINIEKTFLKEVASTGGEGGVVATTAAPSFTGRAGQNLDGVFMGPHHPEYGELKSLLQQQLDDRFAKKDYSKKVTLPYKTAWTLAFNEYEFDKVEKLEGQKKDSKFKTTEDGKYQEVDINVKYDNNLSDFIDKDIFINNTNTFKEISTNYEKIVNNWRNDNENK